MESRNEQGELSNHSSDRTPLDPHILAEYAAAQESAQHHDSLIWTTTGVVWAGNFVLLGFVVNRLACERSGPLVVVGSLLGLVLTAGVWRAVTIWGGVINTKYKRCRELEVPLNMWQHRDVEKMYPRGEMKYWYGLVSIIFLFAWLALFLGGWSHWP